MLTYCSFANGSASPLKEILVFSLVSFYFSLRRVSLAKYFLFPLLLQMARCITGIASTACTLRWATIRTKGMVILYVLPNTFVGHDYPLALYLN
jgi:hypothetical protein